MSHLMIPLDLAGSIVTMAVIAVDLVAVTQVLSSSFARRLVIAAVGGGWVGLRCSSAHPAGWRSHQTFPRR